MTSEEEKRQLILAHASIRDTRPGLGFGGYIGIAASCLVIMTGWWLTLDRNLRTDLPFTANTGFDQVRNSIATFQQNLQNKSAVTSDIADPQAQFRQQVLENAAAQVRQATSQSVTSSAPSVSPAK